MSKISLNIRSGVSIDDAREISSGNFGGNIPFDRDRIGENSTFDERAPAETKSEKPNLVDQQLTIHYPLHKLINITDEKLSEGFKEVIEVDNLFSDWWRKYPEFRIDIKQQNLIESLLNDGDFKISGWHVRVISEILKKSPSFSCLHFISFVMHRKNIAADQIVYNALSSNGFFQNFEPDTPKFGVSKYTPDYFAAYISDSSSFDEALKKTCSVVRRYGGSHSILFDALSSEANNDEDVVDIFDYFGDSFRTHRDNFLTEAFFSNIEMCISKLSTLSTILKCTHKAKISINVIKCLTRYDTTLSNYDKVVELMSEREIPVDKKELASWVFDSPSFEEALKRVRLAVLNNSSDYEFYSSSLGDWVTTSDEFAALKKLNQEIRGTTDWL